MKFIVKGQDITIDESSLAVSGTVQMYESEFVFDEAWTGLTPTAVFRVGSAGTVYEMSLTNGKCIVPAEVLANKGILYVGCYGVNGAKQYPTIWAKEIYVHQGVTDGDTPSTPTPSIYAQIIAQLATKIGDAPSDGKTYGRKNAAWEEVTGGSGGTSDFDQLTNRPKYNGSNMTHSTDIPEVKTSAWDGKYSKPASGIPASDMTSAVQTSLGKADSAVQAHNIEILNIEVSSFGLPVYSGATSIYTAIQTAINAGKDVIIDAIMHTGSYDDHVILYYYGQDSSLQNFYIFDSTAYIHYQAKFGHDFFVVDQKPLALSEEIPTKTSDLENDGEGSNPFLTQHQPMPVEPIEFDPDVTVASTLFSQIDTAMTAGKAVILWAVIGQDYHIMTQSMVDSSEMEFVFHSIDNGVITTVSIGQSAFTVTTMAIQKQINQGASAPLNPSVGDLWIDTN